MFATVTRMPFIRGLAKHEVLFSSTTSKWFQIQRNSSSGLNEIALHKSDMKEVPVEMTFSGFLQQKRDEARRSIVFQINSGNNWQALFNFCNSFGTVKKLYQYTANSGVFIMVEMSSKEELNEIVKKTFGDQNVIHHYALFDNKSLKSLNKINSLHPLDISKIKLNVKLKVKIDEILKYTNTLKGSLSDKINDLSEELRLEDFCIRLRFLTCLQIECLLGGLMRNTTVYPFGSSASGFGFKGCDLDLVVLEQSINFYQDESPVMCFPSKYTDIDRKQMQLHLEVLANLIEQFLVGCKSVNYIKYAKVPIIKFQHYFSSLDCDLSLYIPGGVIMTQLLYSLSSIDERVRPLVSVVRVWAYKLFLTSKQPGPNISNFSFTLLVIFFLQQKIIDKQSILPPLNIFPFKKNLLMDVTEELSAINNFKISTKPNNLSLEELLLLFFKFYSSFNFSAHGICVNTGEPVANLLNSPLYIRNPLDPTLNISKNVNSQQLSKFQSYAICAKEILNKKNECNAFNELFSVKNYSGGVKGPVKKKPYVKIRDILDT